MTVRTITWSHVPPGTQLEVSVVPGNGKGIAGGDIFMEDKGLLPVKQWTDDQLQPGPALEQLKEGIDTTVDIRIVPSGSSAVDGQVTATLRELSSGNELDTQSRRYDPSPGSHDLIRIFADADPVTRPVGAARRGAPGRSKRAGTGRGKKRGK